ncbi:MAG TPA: adenylate/guanylate cyclase domain-containing protein [Roseiflexaceae bacterium]|nr:adenylate/guanylate cyclase domain-containing protein [Roseiflexaceae bacterium]
MLHTIDRKAPALDDLCLDEPRAPERETIARWTGRYTPSFRGLGTRPGEPPAAPAAGLDVWPERCAVLVVDDFEANRRNFSRLLKLQGHTASVAENGRKALALLRERPFDLVLLDILMPEMDGYQVLEQIRADPQLRQIPVVVISGVEDMSSIVRCIELGAADYMLKPCDPLLLRARVSACLETKRLRDQEQAYLQQLQAEQARSERLLLNILPQPIADRLKHSHKPIAEQFDDVTVLFADIVDFTKLAARIAPTELIGLLNEIFSLFDELAERYGLEKIKTIGDSYMAAGGLPKPHPYHTAAVADMALAMQRAIARFSARRGEVFDMRVGISSGPAIAGVIGTKKFIYDLWGDTVNTASRMESHGLPGQIQVCAATYERLRDRYLFEERGEVQVKGKGTMATYLLLGRRE